MTGFASHAQSGFARIKLCAEVRSEAVAGEAAQKLGVIHRTRRGFFKVARGKQCACRGKVQVLQRTEIRHAAFAVSAVLQKKIRLPQLARSKGPDQIRDDAASTVCNYELRRTFVGLDLVEVLSIPESQISSPMEHFRIGGRHEGASHWRSFLGSCDA